MSAAPRGWIPLLLAMLGMGCATESPGWVGWGGTFAPVSKSPERVVYKVDLIVSSVAELRAAAREHCAPGSAVQLHNEYGGFFGLVRIVEFECQAPRPEETTQQGLFDPLRHALQTQTEQQDGPATTIGGSGVPIPSVGQTKLVCQRARELFVSRNDRVANGGGGSLKTPRGGQRARHLLFPTGKG